MYKVIKTIKTRTDFDNDLRGTNDYYNYLQGYLDAQSEKLERMEKDLK